MSTPTPAIQAAAPVLISVLQAMEQFVADMGPDPAQWVLKYPGAKLKLVGTIGLQLPALAIAEGAVAQSAANSLFAGWIKDLQGLAAPAA
jgi:hypothetical protein